MRLFLDTHALLWFLADDPNLSATAKAAETRLRGHGVRRLRSDSAEEELRRSKDNGRLEIDNNFEISG